MPNKDYYFGENTNYRKIAKNNRKKLDKISFKIRVYDTNIAIDFFYKKHLYITLLTNELDEETICKYMIMVYNNYTNHKRFGKKDFIDIV